MRLSTGSTHYTGRLNCRANLTKRGVHTFGTTGYSTEFPSMQVMPPSNALKSENWEPSTIEVRTFLLPARRWHVLTNIFAGRARLDLRLPSCDEAHAAAIQSHGEPCLGPRAALTNLHIYTRPDMIFMWYARSFGLRWWQGGRQVTLKIESRPVCH